MNLEQFKQQFDSEYHKRCVKQEEIIKELHLKISDQNGLIKDQRAEIIVMRNRCIVFSKGVFCEKCGYKNDCEYSGHKS